VSGLHIDGFGIFHDTSVDELPPVTKETSTRRYEVEDMAVDCWW
jgi:hypothetical protein